MNKLTEDILEITPEARDKLENVHSKYITARIAEGEALTRALKEVFDEMEKEQNEQTNTK